MAVWSPFHFRHSALIGNPDLVVYSDQIENLGFLEYLVHFVHFYHLGLFGLFAILDQIETLDLNFGLLDLMTGFVVLTIPHLDHRFELVQVERVDQVETVDQVERLAMIENFDPTDFLGRCSDLVHFGFRVAY